MTPAVLVVCGALLSVLAGAAGVRSPRLGASITAGAGIAWLVAAALVLGGAASPDLLLSWPVPGGGGRVAVDALSAVFLLPIAVVGVLATWYAVEYSHSRSLRVVVGVLLAAMSLVVTAGHGLHFLLCWEAMAIAAFLAITSDHRSPDVRRAGWVYIITTHLGTAALIAMTVLLAGRAGGLAWLPVAGPAQTVDGVILVLALIGFGCKCGLAPLHFWLPGAHANAPSHISALLSGVMLKTGVYGILRITSLLPAASAWWGWTALAVGAATAVYGVSQAVAQGDLKRLLAFSSIENLGIILIGVGLALLGRAHGETALVVLGLGGALLHVLHHALFKPLLFLGAGAILHATGTRQASRLGGLLARMPLTGGLILLGGATACGLPPLAGFAGEWVLYHGLFAGLHGAGGAMLVAALAALALAGALALAAMARLATALVGAPRSPVVEAAHDPQRGMLAPMAVLAAGCLFCALTLPLTVRLITPALACWQAGPLPAMNDLVPLRWIAPALAGVLILGAVLTWWLRRRLLGSPRTVTWDCGYAKPTARMQYTSASFTEPLALGINPGPLRPGRKVERATGLFPAAAACLLNANDAVFERIIRPASEWTARRFARLRALQQGVLNIYLLYVVITVAALLTAALLGRPEVPP